MVCHLRNLRKLRMRNNTEDKLIHTPTGRGDGKWENVNTLRKYLKKRNKKNKAAKKARKQNR